MTIKNPYKKGGMFEGATHLIFENAKQLRKNMTNAETILWMHLKTGVKGLKFRRQHPIGIFIADFYCHKVKLIIEVDGSIHNQVAIKEHDEQRQDELIAWGYHVMRFTNEQVINDIERILTSIDEKILELNNIQKQSTPGNGESKSPL